MSSTPLLIGIINGPNLNLLGKREPHIYGSLTFEDYLSTLKPKYTDVEVVYCQSNIEGNIVNAIQEFGFTQHGLIINPGAYTHTSIAIGDALAAIPIPAVEVHISNIFAREDFRKFSYVSAKAVGTISGLGLQGYELALQHLIERFANRS